MLDEPMSGLDPIGRKDVRDLIVHLREAGKTVFFSTHILPDVEAVCDRIAIITEGRVHDVGSVARLLQPTTLGTDVVLHLPADAALDPIVPPGAKVRRVDEEVTVALPPEAAVEAFLAAACALGKVISVTPRRESLEELFVRRTRAGAVSS